MRELGDGAFAALGRPDLIGRTVYGVEPRFIKCIGQARMPPLGPTMIRVQWPLWTWLRTDERAHVMAHEACHVVAFHVDQIVDHGPVWQGYMRRLGYPYAHGLASVNVAAQLHIDGKRKMSKEKATVWVKDGWIHIRSPYNPNFVQTLKADIPTSSRKFDPIDKVWKVAAAYADDALDVIRKFYGEPVVLDTEVKVVAAPSGDSDDPFGVMLKLAPNDTLKKVYALIAAKVHPDAGGKHEDMVALNDAWERVRRERSI